MRAAAESMIPLISAVGHETDMTLIDFVADGRAPTPTAAAEMAVPVRAELIVEVDSLARRAMACWQRGQDNRRTELRAAARALPRPRTAGDPAPAARHAGAALPRALQPTPTRISAVSRMPRRLTLKVLRGQVDHATQRLTIRRSNRLCARATAAHRRDRFGGLEVRLKASRSPMPRRIASHRARP